LRLETSGKTVIGALIGGYAGVELAKKLAGITGSTGDAFAVAVPLSLGIGRVACLLGGCCYGTPTEVAWHVHLAGADRHPVQLYEALLDFALAGAVYLAREQPRPPGDLFKLSLIGYALIRIGLDPLRGDARVWLGPFSAVQLVCFVSIIALWLAVQRSERTAHATS
jgi:phosphatidylglycerol:prolipoprotein diacylglycerol transferase